MSRDTDDERDALEDEIDALFGAPREELELDSDVGELDVDIVDDEEAPHSPDDASERSGPVSAARHVNADRDLAQIPESPEAEADGVRGARGAGRAAHGSMRGSGQPRHGSSLGRTARSMRRSIEAAAAAQTAAARRAGQRAQAQRTASAGASSRATADRAGEEAVPVSVPDPEESFEYRGEDALYDAVVAESVPAPEGLAADPAQDEAEGDRGSLADERLDDASADRLPVDAARDPDAESSAEAEAEVLAGRDERADASDPAGEEPVDGSPSRVGSGRGAGAGAGADADADDGAADPQALEDGEAREDQRSGRDPGGEDERTRQGDAAAEGDATGQGDPRATQDGAYRAAPTDADTAARSGSERAGSLAAGVAAIRPTRSPRVRKAAPASAETALSVGDLVKRFGDTVAVDHVSLDVRAGSFFGIVGPNGAGKTTTLSMISGLVRPDSGIIRVRGVDVWADPDRAKRSIGVLPDRLRLFDRLTGGQLLAYAGSLRGLDAATVRARVEDLVDALDLGSAVGRLVSDYSTGMAKKVALAAAMIHSPRLLVLDEPLESVDPVSAAKVTELLERYARAGGTVLLSSHTMDLIQRVCDSVAIIVEGRVLAAGTIDEVRDGTSLEERFVELAGGRRASRGMEWLHTFSD